MGAGKVAPAAVICRGETAVDSCFVGLQPVSRTSTSNTYSLFISSHFCARPFVDGDERATEFEDLRRMKVSLKPQSAFVNERAFAKDHREPTRKEVSYNNNV